MEKIFWLDLEEFAWDFLISCIMDYDINKVINNVKDHKQQILDFLEQEHLKGNHFIDIKIEGSNRRGHINPFWHKAVMMKRSENDG